MTKRTFYALVAASIFVVSSLYAQPLRYDNAEEDESVEQILKFNQFYQYLNSIYVDTVDNQMLIEEAIKATLSKLDPHSAYVTAEEMKGVEESFSGSFSGIGIEFNVLNDTIIVVNAISGAPAQQVGLMAGDRIVEVDGNDVVGTTRVDVPKLLRGEKGTKVAVTIVRHSSREPLYFVITRDDIPIETIDAAYKIDDKTGYIKINRFARTTYAEFLEAFASFGEVDALILDLRNNGGGMLDQAVWLSNFFLPRGAVIVETEGRALKAEKYSARVNGPFLDGKVVVLINEASASASEIVAGAIQDWDRGIIIGRRSFGKGLVQRQIPLSDGSAVRITVAHYHTPTGRDIQRPYVNGEQEQYYQDLADRIQSGEDTVASKSSADIYKTLVKGRTVYGGGGIYPDIYIKADTSDYSQDWGRLINQGIINDFVISYVDENRDSLDSQYIDFEIFRQNYAVTDSILEKLYNAASDKNIEIDREAIKVSEQAIRTQIKALVAQKLWSTDEYFIISNEANSQSFNKAIEVLGDWNSYVEQ